MPEIITLTKCPPWCVHDELQASAEGEEPYLWHRSHDLPWGESGAVRLEQLDGRRPELSIESENDAIDIPADAGDIRELAECLRLFIDHVEGAE